MKTPKYLFRLLWMVLALACFQMSAFGQAAEDRNKLATISAGGSSVRWEMAVPYASLTMTISAPDGRIFRKELKSGVSPEFMITDDQGERLPDGQYAYELRLTPRFALGVKEAVAAARGKDDEPEAVRAARKRAVPGQNFVQSGGFAILNGAVLVAGASEEVQRPVSRAAETPRIPGLNFSNLGTRNKRHHPAWIRFDDVIADDLIVQGSACVGLDCVNGEVFGFDTIRVKENNTRIQFDDTSGAGFPTNNWQIRANSSAGGSLNFLAFVDQGATGNSETGTIVFEVDAGAPANSLRVSSTGRIGIRTATPVLDVHANTADTPAIRLEQNNTGGFSAQTWDIAGNEANFFVRDVTSGSRLPFRIRPGAPTSSLDIAASGNVGINNAAPAALLHVLKNQATGTEIRISNSDTAGFAGLYMNGGFALTTGGLVQYNNTTGNTNLFVGTGGADPVHLGTNNSVRMTVMPTTGRVGIGTTAPDQLLSVNGEASKAGGGAWLVFSDERLKTIKGNFTSGLKAVMQLQPLRYVYNQNNSLGFNSSVEHVGFGARALQQVIPEAVSQNDNGYLQVNNDPVIWTMLNAIKEQQKEIQELRREVRQLRAASRRRR
jgi:endosialidase-like protein